MMKKIISVALLCSMGALSGCYSTQELEAMDNHTCNSWGLSKGSDGYAVCRAMQQEQHRDDDRRIAGTLAVAAVVAGAAVASSQ